MKKIVLSVVLIGTMMTMLLTGCSSKSEELSVGMDIGYPPFEYYDSDGTTPVGVDVELSKALAEKMGVEVKLVNTAWDGIFAGLNKGDYDCIISAVTITPERLLDYSFTDPYIQNFQCIVSLKDGNIQVTNPTECEGLKVGYQEETTSDIYLTDYIDANGISVDTYEYAKVMDCFTDLELGRLDAVICDSTVAMNYVTDSDSIYEITWQQDTEPEEFGVCVKKDNTELLDKLNTALKELNDDGTIDEILSKYFS